jgi:hypothetical protein
MPARTWTWGIALLFIAAPLALYLGHDKRVASPDVVPPAVGGPEIRPMLSLHK